MIKPYKTIDSKEVYKSKYIRVFEDNFLGANGEKGLYYYYSTTGNDVVHAVGVDKEKKNFILTRQYRYPVKTIVIDVAGGAMDGDETPEESAVRELYEETGWKGDEIIPLGKCTVDPAKANYWLHEFLVLNCEEKTKPHGGEAVEETEVVKLPIEEAWSFIKENKIHSCHSISTLTKSLLYLGVNN